MIEYIVFDYFQNQNHYFVVYIGVLVFVYSHQLEIVPDSDLKVEILNSYFRGSHYLIECNYKGELLFFENNEAIRKGNILYLKIK
jgi:hypothetical protein